MEIRLKIPSAEDSFTQFIADNVDHNIATFNGTGTFHRMGVAATINRRKNIKKELIIQIPKALKKVDDLVSEKGVPIITDDFPDRSEVNNINLKATLRVI